MHNHLLPDLGTIAGGCISISNSRKSNEAFARARTARVSVLSLSGKSGFGLVCAWQWLVEKITVVDATDEHILVFPCQQWLGKRSPSINLLTSNQPLTSGKTPAQCSLSRQKSFHCAVKGISGPWTTYTVETLTGDVSQASDRRALFFVELVGAQHSSGPLRLESSDQEFKFSRDQRDRFVFELPDLGRICTVRVWRDNQSSSMAIAAARQLHRNRHSWFLRAIVVRSEHSRVYFAHPDGWVKDEVVVLHEEVVVCRVSGSQSDQAQDNCCNELALALAQGQVHPEWRHCAHWQQYYDSSESRSQFVWF